MKNKLTFAALVAALLHSIINPIVAHAEIQYSVGDVYDVKSGELIYREFHTFSKPPAQAFMQTEYKAPEGSLIAERRVNFSDGFASDYVFEQAGLGIRKEVIRGDENIRYISTESGKADTKSFSPKRIESVVVNAGMFNAVEREWDALMAGEKVKIDLVVPERARTFRMVMKRVPANDSEMAKHLNTDNKAVFKLSIGNRLLRLIVGAVELGYDTETKRLVFYQGPSNIRRDNGKKIGDIRIAYKNS